MPIGFIDLDKVNESSYKLLKVLDMRFFILFIPGR